MAAGTTDANPLKHLGRIVHAPIQIPNFGIPLGGWIHPRVAGSRENVSNEFVVGLVRCDRVPNPSMKGDLACPLDMAFNP